MEILLIAVLFLTAGVLGLNQIAKNLNRQAELLAEIRDILRSSPT
jgi:hypothetical protein